MIAVSRYQFAHAPNWISAFIDASLRYGEFYLMPDTRCLVGIVLDHTGIEPAHVREPIAPSHLPVVEIVQVA